MKHIDAIEHEAVVHPDDIAINRFADAMKAKMAKQRAKGYGGWNDKNDCPTNRLQQMLVNHISKGDPVDVANFAMMLWSRGERTEQPAQQQEPTIPDNSQEWRGMDGATAYWLIQRHADGWADIGKMMGEWLAANQPAQQQEPVATYNGSNDFGHDVIELEKSLPIGAKLYTSPPASKPWVGLTRDERMDIINRFAGQDWVYAVEAIETKLREKNAAPCKPLTDEENLYDLAVRADNGGQP